MSKKYRKYGPLAVAMAAAVQFTPVSAQASGTQDLVVPNNSVVVSNDGNGLYPCHLQALITTMNTKQPLDLVCQSGTSEGPVSVNVHYSAAGQPYKYDNFQVSLGANRQTAWNDLNRQTEIAQRNDAPRLARLMEKINQNNQTISSLQKEMSLLKDAKEGQFTYVMDTAPKGGGISPCIEAGDAQFQLTGEPATILCKGRGETVYPLLSNGKGTLSAGPPFVLQKPLKGYLKPQP